jgi:hypothetical protein
MKMMITDSTTNWIPTLRNVFSKDVQEFESKKGKPLEKQSRNNQEKFLKGLMTKYNNRIIWKRKGLTAYQFSLHWGKSIVHQNPETINIRLGN